MDLLWMKQISEHPNHKIWSRYQKPPKRDIQIDGKKRKARNIEHQTYCERHLDSFQHGIYRYVVYATLQWYRLVVPLYTKKYKKQGEC